MAEEENKSWADIAKEAADTMRSMLNSRLPVGHQQAYRNKAGEIVGEIDRKRKEEGLD